MKKGEKLQGGGWILLDVVVSPSVLKTWTPERIAAYFEGMAMVLRAVNGPDADRKARPKESER